MDNVRMKMAIAFVRWPRRSLECPREGEAKMRIPGGGMMMSRRLLRRRKIVSNAYTWIGVQTT